MRMRCIEIENVGSLQLSFSFLAGFTDIYFFIAKIFERLIVSANRTTYMPTFLTVSRFG